MYRLLLCCLMILICFEVNLCTQPVSSVIDKIKRSGYIAELHEVITDDGYYLSLYRMSQEISNNSTKSKKIPVLLAHGLLMLPDSWLYLPNSLPYLLADDGFDVWLLSFRGTIHSRKHKIFDTSDAAFWKFSYHDNAIYDLPATIDYILNWTDTEKLYYVGHSLGTTIFFAFLSEKPEYNEKIKAMIAYAPCAYLGHIRSSVYIMGSHIVPFLKAFAETFNMYEIFPYSEQIQTINKIMCEMNLLHRELFVILFFSVAGFDYAQLDRSIVPDIADTMPGGNSIYQAYQAGRAVVTGKFGQEDGLRDAQYGNQIGPLDYNLQNVKCPVALFVAANDFISNLEDLSRLTEELPNIVLMYKVPYKWFNHFDYLIARDAKELVYDETLDFLKEWNSI